MKLIPFLYSVFSISFAFPTSKVSDGDTKANFLENKNRLENDLPKFLIVNNSTSDLSTGFILNTVDSGENEVMDEVIKITDSELKDLKNNVTSEVFDSIKSLITDRMINATPSANLTKKEGEVALKSLIETAFKKVVKFVDDKDKINGLIKVDVDSSNTTWNKLTSNLDELSTSMEDDNINKEKVVLDNKDNENIEITDIDDDLGSNENIQRHDHSDVEDDINKQVIIFDSFLTTILNDTDARNQESPTGLDSTIWSHEIFPDRNDTTSKYNDTSALPINEKENEEENDNIEDYLKPLAFSDYELELTTEYFETNKDNQNTIKNADVIEEIKEVIIEKSALIADEEIGADVQKSFEPKQDVENDDDNNMEEEQPHKLGDNKISSSNQSEIPQNTSVIDNEYSENSLEDENKKSTNGKEYMELNNSNFQITSHKTEPETKKIEDTSITITSAAIHANDEHSTEEMHDVFISLLEDATDNNISPKNREDDDGISSTTIFSSHFNDDDTLKSSTQSIFLNINEETSENYNKTNFDAEQYFGIGHFVLTTVLPVIDDKYIEENKAVVEENELNDEVKEAGHVNRKENQNINENQDSTSDRYDIIPVDSTTLLSRLDTEYDQGIATKLHEMDVFEIESTTLHFTKDDIMHDIENEKKISSNQEQETELNDSFEASSAILKSTEVNIKALLLSDGKNVTDEAEVDDGKEMSSSFEHNELTQVTSQQELIKDQLSKLLSREEDIVTESPVVNKETDEESVVTPPQESYEANQDIIRNFDINLGEDLENSTNGNEGNNVNNNTEPMLTDLGNVSNNNLVAENLIATGNDSNFNYINNQIDLEIRDKLEATEAPYVTNDIANEGHPATESITQVDELTEVKKFDTFDASEKDALESPAEITITSKLESDDNILNTNEYNFQQMNLVTKGETNNEGHSVPLVKEPITIFQSIENNLKENLNRGDESRHEKEYQFASADSKNEVDLKIENTNEQQLKVDISQDNGIEIEEELREEKLSALNPVLNDSLSVSKESIKRDRPNHEENNNSVQIKNDSKLKNTKVNELVVPWLDIENKNDILVDKISANFEESPQNTKMLEISSNINKNSDSHVSPEVVSALLEIFNKVLDTYNITLSDDVTTNAKGPISNKRKSPKLRTTKTRNLDSSSRPAEQFSKEKNVKNSTEKRHKDGVDKYVIIDLGSILKNSMELKTSKSSLESKDEIPEWREIMEFESTRINKSKETISKENKVAFVPIVKQARTQDSNGEYSFMFESADGTYRSETGKRIKNFDGALSQKGEYSFLLPNGERFNLKYVADEAGFQPESDYIPGPHRQIPQQPKSPKAQRPKTKRRKLRKRNLRKRKQ